MKGETLIVPEEFRSRLRELRIKNQLVIGTGITGSKHDINGLHDVDIYNQGYVTGLLHAYQLFISMEDENK